MLVGGTGADGIDGIAFLGGTLYGISGDTGSLYTLNTATGAATLVGSLGITFQNQTGLGVDPSGTLFGLDDDGALFSINPSTGAATSLSSSLDDFESLTFAPAARAVPEPASLAMLGAGLAMILLAFGWRRQTRRHTGATT